MRLLFILAFVLMQFGAMAVAVPSVVEKTFKTKYPTAADVEWFDEEDGGFAAYFYINEESKTAIFSAEGMWIETKTFIEDTQLPKAVTSTIQAKYKNASISSATLVEKPSTVNQYEISAEASGMTYLLTFDHKGTLLKVLEEAEINSDDDSREEFPTDDE